MTVDPPGEPDVSPDDSQLSQDARRFLRLSQEFASVRQGCTILVVEFTGFAREPEARDSRTRGTGLPMEEERP